MSWEEKKEYTTFFKERNFNCAWTYSYMSNLDPNLIIHHLSIAPTIKPPKQKIRKMHPHVAMLIKEELENLLKE